MRYPRKALWAAALCAAAGMWVTGCGGPVGQPAPASTANPTSEVSSQDADSLSESVTYSAPASGPELKQANPEFRFGANHSTRGVNAPMDAAPAPAAADPLAAGLMQDGAAARSKDLAGRTSRIYGTELATRPSLGKEIMPGELSELRKKDDYYRNSTDHPEPTHNTEAYDAIVENPFQRTSDEPLSTFSVDVDTASYANVRRMLNMGRLPPAGAVRIEELVNYFTYNDAPPTNHEPFAVHAETSSCPWNPANRLVRFGLKGRIIDNDKRPLTNLVFLLDVSGSMNEPNKLPLVKESLRLLTQRLGENDRVAIVVYAGASGLALPSTSATQQSVIGDALDRLAAGGSTNGGEGIALAYRIAEDNKIPGGVNRVVLCTDGDFNVGVTSRSELVEMVERNAKSGVFLSVLGFGMGNLKDSTMEQLADKGNGNYAYIDTINEAKKVLGEQLSGTLVTIAKDVKIQIEFNPRMVAGYRLLGYENRMLAAQDFKDDAKDAGEIGAGHTVTALYEIVPAGGDTTSLTAVDPLRYQQTTALTDAASSNELLTLKLRYKQPDGNTSDEIRFTLKDSGQEFVRASENLRFAASVAAFGMLLRHSQHKGEATLGAVAEWASTALGDDENGYRREFIELVQRAQTVSGVSMR